MFHLKALELMNWDCYPHYQVPLDGEIVLLVGQNGSGKTTFLDALRILLNASRLSKNRTLHHYIQKDVKVAMIKAVVTNKVVGNKRPFAHLGIYGDTDVSLVCLMYNRGPQKIDKEYFILKGDVPAEELSKLKNGLKPLHYSRQLEEAGVSRSTLKLIALEQGQTDRIGQLSPGDLLQLVMDITGNREIIRKYETARQNYRQTFQQLIHLQTEYNKICQQNEHLEKQAHQAQLFKEILAEKDVIEREKLPLSRWYRVLNQLHEAEKAYEEVQEKKSAMEKQTYTIPKHQELLTEKIQQMEENQRQLREKQLHKERQLNSLHQQIGQCHSEWQRLDEIRRTCERIDQDTSTNQMTVEMEELQSRYYQEKNELAQLQNQVGSHKKALSSMEKGRLPSYPDDVLEFREVLDRGEIFNLLFAEAVEILEPEWQLAIEAFLGRERFSLFVAEKDLLQAKKLGEKHRYGFYISPFTRVDLPPVRENSILSYLKISDDRVGERLLPLNEVLLVKTVEEGHRHARNYITITVQGYRQDRRGGIFIAKNVRFYCGGLAVERQRQEIDEEIAAATREIEKRQAALTTLHGQIRKIEDRLIDIKRREEWLSSKDRYETLKRQGEQLLLESEEAVKDRDRLTEEMDRMIAEKNQFIAEHRELQRQFDKNRQDQQQIADLVLQREQRLLQLRWEKEEMGKQIPAQTSRPYTPEQLEPPEWLEHKLKELVQEMETFAGCRDLAMIDLYEHEVKQMEGKKRELLRQEQDQSERSQELEKCRDDYREMIVQTVNFYNKAVKDLADLAGCRMRVNLELGHGECLVEDARLYGRISFDQKAEVDIHDKSLSGGQDVIASLILLVALSRLEKDQPSGFFIMDEHNAHLDMLRIMEVGHFLRSTKAQFVLTTPTTENMAALAVADLILTFTKKSSAEEYAPKPRYIRRM